MFKFIIELIYSEDGWEPYFYLDDALKSDKVWKLLRQDKIKMASQLGQIFTLTPFSV